LQSFARKNQTILSRKKSGNNDKYQIGTKEKVPEDIARVIQKRIWVPHLEPMKGP
jgi:hypothetical protein